MALRKVRGLQLALCERPSEGPCLWLLHESRKVAFKKKRSSLVNHYSFDEFARDLMPDGFVLTMDVLERLLVILFGRW